VEKKLEKKATRCQTALIPVLGGAIHGLEEFTTQAFDKKPAGVNAETLRHLLQTYGSEYREILRYYEEDPVWGEPVTSGSPVIKAEVVHGVREEMAEKLRDVIFRRTELGTAGYPGDACFKICAEIMGTELGWDPIGDVMLGFLRRHEHSYYSTIKSESAPTILAVTLRGSRHAG